jgi:pyruvate,water dikinase
VTATATSFVPPSPGSWELEQTHVTKPPSVFFTSVFPAAMMRGFKAGTHHYGLLLDHLEVGVINRFVYYAPRPVGAPKGAKGPPPRAIFKLMTLFHPEIRRRISRSREVLDGKLWREDIVRWDNEIKPAFAAEARRLREEPLEQASNAQLADHVRRATTFLDLAMFWHHRLNGCVLVPLGDYLIQAMDWTGLSPSELLAPMRGRSPVSAGAQEELEALRPAIQSDGAAVLLLVADQPADKILTGLLDRPTSAGAAVRAYVDAVGMLVIGGYDIADRHAGEHPELLVKIIRAAVLSDESVRSAEAEHGIEQLRARVPSEHRNDFDHLLAEAQATYRIRDERIFHGDALATGLARRAVLAAGARLVRDGRVHHAIHLVDATPDEIASLLEGRGGPSADELAERSRWRLETAMSSAPATLGLPPSPPPPPEWLPAPADRMARIVTTVMSLLFDVKSDAAHAAPAGEVKRLKGFPVSSGVYEGPARVITNVDQLHEVQQGEVLITPSTGPTFNVVLPLIGALVTERGGVLSHAAIVSREYGLPGVVGCVGAVKAAATGQRVRVDGGTGELWILE